MRRQHRVLVWAVWATVANGLLVVSGGCGRPANRLEGVTEVQPPPGPAVDERVVINSRTLDRKLRFGPVLTRKEGLILHVQVSVENPTKNIIPFEYRWEWTDASGFQLGDTLSSWQPAVV